MNPHIKTKPTMINYLLKIRYFLIRTLLPWMLKDTSPEKKDLEMVFCDNFIQPFWHGQKWDVGSSNIYHPRRLWQWYGPPFIRKGKGVFRVRYNPKTIHVYQMGKHITFPFETSRIRTVAEFQHGRFECRMSMPTGKFAWPAFWLWGAPWPPEIDVIEAYGRESGNINEQEINLHWGTQQDHKQLRPWRIKIGKRRFHEFAIEWHPHKIDFFTNGIKVFSFRNRKILDKWFSQKMWIVVNHAIKKQMPRDYYSEFEVDYVRAYKLKYHG